MGGLAQSPGPWASGSGVPAAGLATVAGLYYFRTDTPAVANQRLYVSTGVGTWVGIL